MRLAAFCCQDGFDARALARSKEGEDAVQPSVPFPKTKAPSTVPANLCWGPASFAALPMLLDELDVLDIVTLRGAIEHEFVADDLDERGMRDTGEGDCRLAGVES